MRKIYFPVLLIIVAVFSYLVTVQAGEPKTNSSLQIEVAPQSSKVTVDGHSVKAGTIKLFAGPHTVTVSKQGFSTQNKSVSTTAGQTAYAGIVLQSDNASTSDWYSSNPQDQQLVGVIGSHNSDNQTKLALQAIPFFKQLPIVYGNGHGGITSVSPGNPVPPATLPAAYITAETVQDHQNVITYMKSRGYDLARMDFVFYTIQNPLLIQGDD